MQPLLFVPDTVYTVVADAEQCTDEPVVEVNPVAGNHEYVSAPVADISVEDPLHIAADAALGLMTGNGFMVSSLVAELIQPLALVPVMV